MNSAWPYCKFKKNQEKIHRGHLVTQCFLVYQYSIKIIIYFLLNLRVCRGLCICKLTPGKSYIRSIFMIELDHSLLYEGFEVQRQLRWIGETYFAYWQYMTSVFHFTDLFLPLSHSRITRRAAKGVTHTTKCKKKPLGKGSRTMTCSKISLRCQYDSNAPATGLFTLSHFNQPHTISEMIWKNLICIFSS